MSARASAYAKALIECPNGELISRGEKLVLIVLADSHQDKAKRFTYPSIDTIAPEAMCDRRSCQRYMASLEQKGVIKRLRPANQGRGMQVFYFFTALDEIPEGWQSATLFDAPFFAQKGGRRAAEGRQKGDRRVTNSQLALLERAQERELQPEQEQKQVHPPKPPQAGESGECLPEECGDASTTKDRTASVAQDYVPGSTNGTLRNGRDDSEGNANSTQSLLHGRQDDSSDGSGNDADAAGGKSPVEGSGESLPPRPGNARAGSGIHLAAQRLSAQDARAELKVDGSVGQALEDAVDQVMRGCGFTARRLRVVIREVLCQETQDSEKPYVLALSEALVGMVEAWEDFTSQGARLRFKWGARKFFAEGYWRNRESWPWDNEVLKQEQLQAQARVGSTR